MRKIRDVLRLDAGGLSKRQVVRRDLTLHAHKVEILIVAERQSGLVFV